MNPGIPTIAAVTALGLLLSKKSGSRNQSEKFLLKLKEMGWQDYPWESKRAIAYRWDDDAGHDCWVIVIFVRYNRDDPNFVILDLLKVGGANECLRKGYGTQAMKMITEAADETKTRIDLVAVPFGTMGMPDEKLKEWYGSFGFVPRFFHGQKSDNLMERFPKGSTNETDEGAQIFNLHQQRLKRNPLTWEEIKRNRMLHPNNSFLAIKDLVEKTKKDGRKVSFGPSEEYTVEELGEMMRKNPDSIRYIVRDFGRNFTRSVIELTEADGMGSSNESQIKVIRVEKRRAGFKPQRLMPSMASGRLHDPNKIVGAWVTVQGPAPQALRNYQTIQPILLAEARKIGLFQPHLIFMDVYQSRRTKEMWEAKWELKG